MICQFCIGKPARLFHIAFDPRQVADGKLAQTAAAAGLSGDCVAGEPGQGPGAEPK